MRHLVLSLLMLSVTSFPQDLDGQFADDFELASNSVDPDSIFTDPTLADSSSDFFGPSLATADGLGPVETEDLGEFPPLDIPETSLSPPNAGFELASWPDGPEYNRDYYCDGETSLACCFHSDMSTCTWYDDRDPNCYYESDLRCCKDIQNHVGVECGPALRRSQAILPAWIGDFLRTEVPTDWLEPLLGGSVWDH